MSSQTEQRRDVLEGVNNDMLTLTDRCTERLSGLSSRSDERNSFEAPRPKNREDTCL